VNQLSNISEFDYSNAEIITVSHPPRRPTSSGLWSQTWLFLFKSKLISTNASEISALITYKINLYTESWIQNLIIANGEIDNNEIASKILIANECLVIFFEMPTVEKISLTIFSPNKDMSDLYIFQVFKIFEIVSEVFGEILEIEEQSIDRWRAQGFSAKF